MNLGVMRLVVIQVPQPVDDEDVTASQKSASRQQRCDSKAADTDEDLCWAGVDGDGGQHPPDAPLHQ